MTARRVFWLLLVLTIVGAYHYRRFGLDLANFGYQLARLHFAQTLIAQPNIHGNPVSILAEQTKGKSIKFKDLKELEPIIKKAFNDHAIFLRTNYPEIYFKDPGKIHAYPKGQRLSLAFVFTGTYEAINPDRQKNSAGFYLEFLDTIYFQVHQNPYSIKEMRETIRHEIFHYLNKYYAITDEFEEAAAQRFGGMK